jgi:O-methyltransferase
MPKRSLYRLAEEDFTLPYYLLDSNFASPQDYLHDIRIMPPEGGGDNGELFTSLNIEISQLSAIAVKNFCIPVCGWDYQADYFFSEGYFKVFSQKLVELITTFPATKIVLEFQLNCLSLHGLYHFLEKFVEFKKDHNGSGCLALEFAKRGLPVYLNLSLLKEAQTELMKKSADLMKSSDQFDQTEISQLEEMILPAQDYGTNSSRQMLATFYYSLLLRGSKDQTIKTFPGVITLLKKSAEAFLEINPNILKNSFSPYVRTDENYSEIMKEKINSFHSTKFPHLEDEEKSDFLNHFLKIKDLIPCEHSNLDMLEVALAVLTFPEQTAGVIVEAGLFKGGGTARLSLACKFSKRELFGFDSFRGLPVHEESSPNVLYPPGVYFGSKAEVQENLKKYGAPEVVTLVEGWFEETMPNFHRPVAIAYLDVDLLSSTKVCIRYLWPQLIQGGVIFCHDGHLPEIAKLIHDPEFWQHEFNEPLPDIATVFGKMGFIKITKT